jgi:hypothetical protein
VKLNSSQNLERTVNSAITYISKFGGKSYAYKVLLLFFYLLTFPKCLNTPHTTYDIPGLETQVFLI